MALGPPKMAGLPSVPAADDLVKSQLIATEHAAVEAINTVSRTLVGGSKGAAGLASGLPVLAEAFEALDSTIEPGMRFTALYPARIDPHLPPSERLHVSSLPCPGRCCVDCGSVIAFMWLRASVLCGNWLRRHHSQLASERKAAGGARRGS